MTTNTDGAMPELPEPAHWRAVLDAEQVPQQLKRSLHVVGFRDKRAVEGWIAERLDFDGWRYTLEGLYTADQVRAAIQQAAGAVPEGWKLVPVHPTVEMLDAADEGDRAYTLRNFGAGPVVMQGPEDHYAAMLAASPAPPKQQPIHFGGGEVGGVPQWQPIETAPEHGAVLVFTGTGGIKIERTENIHQLLREAKASGEGCYYTHWMHLPDDPTAPHPESPTGQINKPATAGQGMEGGDRG